MAVVKPKYLNMCACGQPGGYCVVLHLWPTTMRAIKRTKDNSTKLYPDVEACTEHRFAMAEMGRMVYDNLLLTIHQHFDTLGRDAPDLNDILIELTTTAEAEKMWADVAVASPADGHATILHPELLLPTKH